MPPKVQKEIVQTIQTPEQFLELISPEYKKLVGKYSISHPSTLYSD